MQCECHHRLRICPSTWRTAVRNKRSGLSKEKELTVHTPLSLLPLLPLFQLNPSVVSCFLSPLGFAALNGSGSRNGIGVCVRVSAPPSNTCVCIRVCNLGVLEEWLRLATEMSDAPMLVRCRSRRTEPSNRIARITIERHRNLLTHLRALKEMGSKGDATARDSF
jgi:hypothetical protein